MTQNKTVEVEIEISDEEFLTLAKIAHERRISFNDLCVQILQDYVAVKRQVDPNDVLEENLIKTTRNILMTGVTEETLSAYGYAFSEWAENSTRETTCKEIIQKGFVAADIM